jgi:uncharacterized membrane protein
LAAGLTISWTITPLVTWNILAIIYVVRTWATVSRYSPDLVKSHALREDPSRPVADLVLLMGVIVSLAAVGGLLIGAGGTGGPAKAGFAALSLLSVIASWLVVHTLFALRYAELYYTKPVGGVDFSPNHEPVYADFAYMAFTIGMTYQKSV